MKVVVEQHLAAVKSRVLSIVRSAPEKVAKAAMRKDELERLHEQVTDEDQAALELALGSHLKAISVDGAEAGLEQLGMTFEDLLNQANEDAVAWAKEHAAELVTEIDTTTRDKIRDLVAASLEDGTTNGDLADQFEEAFAFSGDRADMVARTETAFADIAGNLAGWRASGVVARKRWLVSQDKVCEDCEGMDGQEVDLEDEFPGGDPPLHPNCRCDLVPVLSDNEEED